MLKLKDLIKEFATVGGVVTTRPFMEAGIVSRKSKSSKLRDIVNDIYGNEEVDVDEGAFLEAVSKYNKIGTFIHREGNLKDVAEHLSKLAKTARAHTLRETDDWFDKVSVNRNMKELNILASSFSKVATEAQAMQERMSTLYEDMGHIINRYYDISEIEEASKSYRHEPDHEDEEEKVKESVNEAVKGLAGFKKHLDKTKGKLLFYAESPDGEVFMGVAQTKNKKFVLGVGTPFPPSGASISAPEIGDEYSSLSQAKAGVKDQMHFAKKGYSHPDEKKFSWKVVVDKLNESITINGKKYRRLGEEDNVDEMDDLDSPESGDKDKYTAFFDKALKDYGEEIGKSIDSPADLDDEQKKEFFNWIQGNWKAAE